jgi:hypothetical protein
MPIFVALIVSSFRASEQLARALEARGFNAPGVRRTAWIELRFRAADGLWLGLLLALTAAVLYLHLRLGSARALEAAAGGAEAEAQRGRKSIGAEDDLQVSSR